MTKHSEAKQVSLKPVGFRVLAKRLEQEEVMKGGIIIPDSAKKKQETLVVIRVGQPQIVDGKEIPIPVNEGDHILMDKYSGQEVTINDEEFVIIKADEIVAIVE
ncbi:MAG: co-chaperone GroES [Chlamydiota bacterium]